MLDLHGAGLASGHWPEDQRPPLPKPTLRKWKGGPQINLDETTAEDVVEALRLALMQKGPNSEEALKLVRLLLDYAPDSASSRGLDLLTALILEGAISVAIA